MSNEIRAYYKSGLNLYACIRDTSGQVWYISGQVFETWGTGGRDADDYDIPLTDYDGNMYLEDFDTNISAGYYTIIIYYRGGASAADSDPLLSYEEGYWTGSAWRSMATQLQTIASDIIVIDTVADTIASDVVVVDGIVDTIASDIVVIDGIVDTVASDVVVIDGIVDTIASDIIVLDAVADTIASDLVIVASDIVVIDELVRIQNNDFADGGGVSTGGSTGANSFNTTGEIC